MTEEESSVDLWSTRILMNMWVSMIIALILNPFPQDLWVSHLELREYLRPVFGERHLVSICRVPGPWKPCRERRHPLTPQGFGPL